MPSVQDTLLLAVGVGIVIHFVYNRLEPRKLRYHFALLFVVPAGLAFISAPFFSSVPSTLLYIYPTFFASLVTSVVLYRLSPFHPLARFPGPIIHRISNFFMLKIAESGKRHLYFRELHEKYGPFVRVGPNDLSIVDAGAIYPVLGTKGVPRGEVNQMFDQDEEEVNLFSTFDQQQHAEFRKAWHRGLTPTALKGYDPIFAKRVGQLIDYLGKQQGAIDLGKWISYYKYDFMGDLVFGGGFELMKAGGDLEGYWAIQDEGMKMGGIIEHIPWIGRFLQRLPLSTGISRNMEFGNECVRRRVKMGSMTHDLFHYFAEEDKPEEQRPPIKRTFHHAGGAIIAAADTTTSTMTGLFYHILRYPDLYKRLQAEVDSFYDRGEEIVDNQSLLAQMPFLNACIDETLRILPALPTMLQRAIPRGRGGIMICGRMIPDGTHIIIPPYTLLRDRRYFSPIPDTFWPDRWLFDPSDEKNKDTSLPGPFTLDTSAFIPFSFGPANCIGKQLAYKEMRLVVATILQKYELRLADGYDPERFMNELQDHIVLVKSELPVIITPRS